MATNNADETTEEQLTDPTTGMPLAQLGDADVRIDVDRETYHRIHEAYCRAVDDGYSEGFDTFAFNHCSTDCYVTVGGEPVDPENADGGSDA